MRLEIIIGVLIIIIFIIYYNMDKLSITEMVVITVSLALFMFKTDTYKKFLATIVPENKSNFTDNKTMSNDRVSDPVIDENIIKQINNKVRIFDKLEENANNNRDRKKKLSDEMKESMGDYSNDARPIIPLIKQKAFAAEAAKIRSAGYNINSIRKFYDEELDKAQSSEWIDVNNEMDDKLYGIQLQKISGSR